MKPFVFVVLLFLSLHNFTARAQTKQVIVPYTLADRDRAINISVKLNTLVDGLDSKFASFEGKFVNIDKQFTYQRKQLDDLKTLLYFGFGILCSLFIIWLGYLILDRRSLKKLVSKYQQGDHCLAF